MSNAIVFKSLLAKKVIDLMESDPEADDSVADVAIRNAVLDCLSLLAQKGTEKMKELIDVGHAFNFLDMLLVSLMNELNMFMLLIGQVVARGRNWWKLQIAMVSNLELRLLWIIEQMAMCEEETAGLGEQIAMAVKAEPKEPQGEDGYDAEEKKHMEAKEEFETEK